METGVHPSISGECTGTERDVVENVIGRGEKKKFRAIFCACHTTIHDMLTGPPRSDHP